MPALFPLIRVAHRVGRRRRCSAVSKAGTDVAAASRRRWLGAALAMLFVIAWLPSPGAAQQRIAVVDADLNVNADIDPGLFLNAQFDFELPYVLEDAVQRGVALYFVVELELTRSRWYWFDKQIATPALTWRLTYSPLTRQYRLARGALAQPFDTLGEALATIRRLRNWRVGERATIEPGGDYEAKVRLRLDNSLLPKPFQVNALTNRDWALASDWHPVRLPEAGR